MNKSGLHPVYQSGAQAAKEAQAPSDSDRKLDKPTDRALSQAPSDSDRKLAAHWQKEAERMKCIASDSVEEAKLLKQDMREQRNDLEEARMDSDDWKQRYNEMALARNETKTAHAMAVKGHADSTASLQKRLDKTLKALEEHKDRLKAVDEERPEVVEKLQVGGMAFRELKALKAGAAQVQAGLQARVRELELLNASNDEKLRAAAANGVSASIKAKLLSTTLEVSALTSKVKGCSVMLVKTEQVLRACSELHVGKDLASALKETSTNVAAFLATLKPI